MSLDFKKYKWEECEMEFLKFNKVWYVKYFEGLGLKMLLPPHTWHVAITRAVCLFYSMSQFNI